MINGSINRVDLHAIRRSIVRLSMEVSVILALVFVGLAIFWL